MKKPRRPAINLDGQTYFDLSLIALNQQISVKKLLEKIVIAYVIKHKPNPPKP